MSIFLEREIDCPSGGAAMRVVDFDSVNVDGLLRVRRVLIDSEFMRHRCEYGHELMLDHPLLWMDLDLGLLLPHLFVGPYVSSERLA